MAREPKYYLGDSGEPGAPRPGLLTRLRQAVRPPLSEPVRRPSASVDPPPWGSVTPGPRPGGLSADDVRAARFSASKMREGYDQEEVDEFLERVEHYLRQRESGQRIPPPIDEVVNARFQATRFRPGYDQNEVDEFLDRIVAELRSGG